VFDEKLKMKGKIIGPNISKSGILWSLTALKESFSSPARGIMKILIKKKKIIIISNNLLSSTDIQDVTRLFNFDS